MNDTTARISAIEDKLAIKNLVDTFSILADRKDVANQVFLLAENATVQSRVNGQLGEVLTGRKQVSDAFGPYLSSYETVYHSNGQQTVHLNGDKATAISYCTVTLIGAENGSKMKTVMGVVFNDELVKENEQWLIAKRITNFVWQETTPFIQQ